LRSAYIKGLNVFDFEASVLVTYIALKDFIVTFLFIHSKILLLHFYLLLQQRRRPNRCYLFTEGTGFCSSVW